MSNEPSPSRSTARKQRFIKGLTLILSLGIAVLFGEIGLRLFLPRYIPSGSREREMFCQFDRELGWIPTENVTAIHTSDSHAALVHQNQFGLRGPND
ncbi:MAG TPA: hypothetical protein VK192_00185, partial [Sphingomicrobium sp.]|nr:hypothetical protein [Sphingomicrobium sp.]